MEAVLIWDYDFPREVRPHIQEKDRRNEKG